MKYQQLSPPATLAGYVRYFWILTGDGHTDDIQTFAPLADGCPGIMYQAPAAGLLSGAGNSPLPALFLYGQTITPFFIHLQGHCAMTGVCFYPHALPAIFGFDAGHLTGTCTDMDSLTHAWGFRLSEQLQHACTPGAQLSLLGACLEEGLHRHSHHADAGTGFALSLMIRTQGDITLKHLHSELSISERSFERRFNRHVGVSPKMFTRICRFQAALLQLRNNHFRKLSDIAFDNGYADQSHFIRAFKEFTGHTPLSFREQLTEAAENFALRK